MNLEALTNRGREIVVGVYRKTFIDDLLQDLARERRRRNQYPGIRRMDRAMVSMAVALGATGVGLDYFCGSGSSVGVLPLSLSIGLSGASFFEQIGFSS